MSTTRPRRSNHVYRTRNVIIDRRATHTSLFFGPEKNVDKSIHDFATVLGTAITLRRRKGYHTSRRPSALRRCQSGREAPDITAAILTPHRTGHSPLPHVIAARRLKIGTVIVKPNILDFVGSRCGSTCHLFVRAVHPKQSCQPSADYDRFTVLPGPTTSSVITRRRGLRRAVPHC